MLGEVKLNPYQVGFYSSRVRFPSIVSSIGTGKTMLGLLKVWSFCEKYPNTLAMIVRKSFTDLRDSTLKDMKTYFGVDFDSNKEYKFPNGSVIMARHGDELAVLKNINLSLFLIEQAEEFETDETFIFLRDRLRRQTSPYRQGLIIANANGQNWVWKLWVNGAEKIEVVDEKTGQYIYRRGEYECYTANSFANEHNLPADFVKDLRQMAVDAPNHYAQYVMNSFEVVDADDFVFNFSTLKASALLEFPFREGFGYKICGFDIARYGQDKCAAVALKQVSSLAWEECHEEVWDHKDLDYTTGRILAIARDISSDENIIDEDGLGGGPLDTIVKGRRRTDFLGFRNRQFNYGQDKYFGNPRTRAAFRAKEMVDRGHLKIKSPTILQELMTLRFKYMNDGRKILVSKEEMKKEGIKSPNLADAVLMAVSRIDDYSVRLTYSQGRPFDERVMAQAREDDLFQIAGIR